LAREAEPGWLQALAPVERQINTLRERLREEASAGRRTLPDMDRILRAFRQPFADVRVLIVGQDPYPTPGHATGLAFSLERNVRPLPPSLVNVYRELSTDLGVAAPGHGDLTAWSRRGVLLLNRALTLTAGAPGSHRGLGWEVVTERVAVALAVRGTPLVAVLWGDDAGTLRPLLRGVDVVHSAHPSAATAHTGFFGSRPFSTTNGLLAGQGAAHMDWTID
jgi:uracil-DNA glycosylase